jgi:hypothetical protein
MYLPSGNLVAFQPSVGQSKLCMGSGVTVG